MDRVTVRVSSQDGAVEAFGRIGAGHAVSLLDPGVRPPEFPGLPSGRHLVLPMHDLDGPEPGYREPADQDVAALVALGRSLPDGGRVLVHCAAGISRSPAAAAVIICAAEGPERARRFLLSEGLFLPNALILSIADRLLGTDGFLAESGRLAEAAVTDAIHAEEAKG